MGAWVSVLIVVATIVVLATIVFLFVRRRRQWRELREWFGPEYDRSVKSARSRKAEGERAGRTGRRQAQEIRPLTQGARERYAARWNYLQDRFANRPRVVVVEADDLVTKVMRDRGYPVDDLETQSELVSVDHRDVVQNYRAAHGIYTKTTTGEASTEDLRRAVIAYRVLFEELVTHGARSDDRRHP